MNTTTDRLDEINQTIARVSGGYLTSSHASVRDEARHLLYDLERQRRDEIVRLYDNGELVTAPF